MPVVPDPAPGGGGGGVRGVLLLRAGLIGRLAMACWPQAGDGLLATGWRWPVGHRRGDGRRGSGWVDRDAEVNHACNESTPQPFGLGRRPVCGGVLSRDIVGRVLGSVKRVEGWLVVG
jgi:hypothetical protein